MRPLVWFRSDLRTRDNTALHEACRMADDGVVGVFTICPEQWKEHDWGAVKVDFILRNLAELSRSLRRINVPLLIVETPKFDGVAEELLELADRHSCQALSFNREYEVNEQRRDEEVMAAFLGSGKSVHAWSDRFILPPDSVRTSSGDFFKVFSPYRRAWLARYKEVGGAEPVPTPSGVKKIDVKADKVPKSVDGFDGLTRPDLWKEGEKHAQSRLDAFVEGRLEEYDEKRDYPSVNGTSTMSPYLTSGVVSARQCLAAALEANNGRIDSGSKGAVTWISELIWREFYNHVLVGFPRVCKNRPFDLDTEKISWSKAEKRFECWKEGKTGYPIVDAAMRQLAKTGWMHNRLRMVSAMFLTKNLFIDWRWGERHFMQSLVDGDFASNNGGWQWSASTGTDAAPYFRVFNPVSQSEKFDADGDFVRKYIPELEKVKGKAIHFPHADGDNEDCPDYPKPLVDHKRTRQEAIDKFKAVKGK